MYSNLMRDHLYGPKEQEAREVKLRAALDSAQEEAANPAAAFEEIAARMDAVAAVQEWIGDKELDENETAADRLLALMVGIADSNQDGELDDDEQEVIATALEAAWDYLATLGVAEDDLDLLLNEWDPARAGSASQRW